MKSLYLRAICRIQEYYARARPLGCRAVFSAVQTPLCCQLGLAPAAHGELSVTTWVGTCSAWRALCDHLGWHLQRLRPLRYQQDSPPAPSAAHPAPPGVGTCSAWVLSDATW